MFGSSHEVYVIRHAQSLEDVDSKVRERMSEEDIPLSEEGRAQAISFGIALSKRLRFQKSFKIFVAPTKRVVETAELIVAQLQYVQCDIIKNNLLKKQDTGVLNLNNRTEIDNERYKTGVLRYKYPGGESGWEALERFKTFAEKLKSEKTKKVLVLTHGFEMRLLLMAMLDWSEDYFESLAHPDNCESKRLVRNNGGFRLKDKMRRHGNPITRLQYANH